MVAFEWSGKSMTPERILAMIQEVGEDIESDQNVVRFRVQNVSVTLIYDTNADRMRLISPVAQTSDLTDAHMVAALEANFHSALDVRYCISNEIMWSAFIHPLSPLNDDQVRSAIRQVAVANLRFGDDYSSGEMVFMG